MTSVSFCIARCMFPSPSVVLVVLRFPVVLCPGASLFLLCFVFRGVDVICGYPLSIIEPVQLFGWFCFEIFAFSTSDQRRL